MSKKNTNISFVLIIIFLCVIIIILLISFLEYNSTTTQYTIPNITTIVGTVLTIGALAFTIREQMKIKSISDAINKNNQDIQKKNLNYSFDFNLIRCLRYVHDIEYHIRNNEALSVLIRLADLKDCLIECKKVIDSKQNSSSFKCLQELMGKNDKELTKQSIKVIWENVTLQEDEDKQSKLNSHVSKLAGYIIAIEVAKCSLNGIRNIGEFISDIEELGSYLNEINTLAIFKIE